MAEKAKTKKATPKTAKTSATKPAVKKKTAKKTAAKKATPKKAGGGTIFFTGFPGFIGRRLLGKILTQDSKAHVLALVQEKFLDSARGDLAALAKDLPGVDRRVEFLVGDLTEKNLGLDAKTRRRLTAEVASVWHLAAAYDLAVSEKVAWKANVDGTSNLLDLCGHLKQLEKLVYFSSCSVAGLRTGLILEDELEFGQGFKNHYEASKFETEVLVRRRASKIPTIIIRPSVVVGDSKTGDTDKYDGPYSIIRFLAQLQRDGYLKHLQNVPMPSLGKGSAYFNLVPVDYLVDATWALANQPASIGKTFAIVDPDPLTMREFYDALYQHFGIGKTLGVLPLTILRAMTVAPGLAEWMNIPEQLLAYVNHYTVFDARNASAALKGTGIACPPLSSYLDTLIDHVSTHLETEGKHA